MSTLKLLFVVVTIVIVVVIAVVVVNMQQVKLPKSKKLNGRTKDQKLFKHKMNVASKQ